VSFFKTERIVMVALPDLAPVARRIIDHFRAGGRDVAGQPCMVVSYGHYMPTSWEITIHERTFRSIGQFRGALKIQLVPQAGTTMVRISAGILGIPAGHEQLAWKIKLGQLWRDIKKSGLHDDALLVSEDFLSQARQLFMEQDGGSPGPPRWPGHPPGQPIQGPPGEAPRFDYSAWPADRHQQPPGGRPQAGGRHPGSAPVPPPDDAYCSGCGTPLTSDARFCSTCGSQRT